MGEDATIKDISGTKYRYQGGSGSLDSTPVWIKVEPKKKPKQKGAQMPLTPLELNKLNQNKRYL